LDYHIFGNDHQFDLLCEEKCYCKIYLEI